MQSTQAAPISRTSLWAGRIISGLMVLFLLFDAIVKLLKAAPAMQGTTQLGYSTSVVFPLGVILLVCVVLYAVPRTSVLGAILLTGYLGGAVATQVRVGHPLFSQILFPVYVGVLLWLGLYLRDERVRAMVPLRSSIT
jgi:hypothetical protein